MEEALIELRAQLASIDEMIGGSIGSEEASQLVAIREQLVDGINMLTESMGTAPLSSSPPHDMPSSEITSSISSSRNYQSMTTFKRGDRVVAPRLSERCHDLGGVLSINEGVDEATVYWLRPRSHKEKVCRFLLDGHCNYTREECRDSHGIIVPLSSLQVYHDEHPPVFNDGDIVWAPYNRVWYKAVVSMDAGGGGIPHDSIKVKFLEYDSTEIVMRHDVIPLSDGERDQQKDLMIVKERNQARNRSRGGGDIWMEEGEETHTLESMIDDDGDNDKSTYRVLQDGLTSPGYIPGDWEEFTRGIGMKLLKKMGYKRGDGLGKDKGGIVKPVTVEIFPKGVGLDYCRNPEDAIERARKLAASLRRKARKERIQKEAEEKRKREMIARGEVDKKDMFGIINSLGGGSGGGDGNMSGGIAMARASLMEKDRIRSNKKLLGKQVF